MATVKVGTRSVAVDVVDGRDPAVIGLSSLGDPGSQWAGVLHLLCSGPRVMTYDRPGIGGSPSRAPNPPLPYSAFAGELAQLLDALGESGPVVLAGHSFGSLIARMFAAAYPDRVAGMVHVDGSIPRFILWPGWGDRPVDGDGPGATEVDTVAGEAQMAEIALPKAPSLVLARTPGRWYSPPPDPSIDKLWQDSQVDLARQLDADLVLAKDSGHRMLAEVPGLVAFAIDEVVRAVREGRKVVRLDAERVSAAGGQLRRVTAG